MLQLLYCNSVYALPLQQIQDSFVSLPIYLISSFSQSQRMSVFGNTQKLVCVGGPLLLISDFGV